MEHRNYKVVYRRYASLFFLLGIDAEEVGELARGAGTCGPLTACPHAPAGCLKLLEA